MLANVRQAPCYRELHRIFFNNDARCARAHQQRRLKAARGEFSFFSFFFANVLAHGQVFNLFPLGLRECTNYYSRCGREATPLFHRARCTVDDSLKREHFCDRVCGIRRIVRLVRSYFNITEDTQLKNFAFILIY